VVLTTHCVSVAIRDVAPPRLGNGALPAHEVPEGVVASEAEAHAEVNGDGVGSTRSGCARTLAAPHRADAQPLTRQLGAPASTPNARLTRDGSERPDAMNDQLSLVSGQEWPRLTRSSDM